MTMPEAVLVSLSTRLTITRSARGRSFMRNLLDFETEVKKQSADRNQSTPIQASGGDVSTRLI
jgi:hypothetical protein